MTQNCRYGNSKAAVILVDVVREHPDSKKIGRKVARTLNQYNVIANYLEASLETSLIINWPESINFSNTSSVIMLYDLLVKEYLNKCDVIFSHKRDNRVCTFIKTVIKSKHKAWLDVHLPKHKINKK